MNSDKHSDTIKTMRDNGKGKSPTLVDTIIYQGNGQGRAHNGNAGDDHFSISDGNGSTPRSEAVLKSIKDQQHEQWRQGKRVPVEEYLRTYPHLQQSGEAFSLVYGEYLLREELGEGPALAEYQQRFPHFAAQLEEQVKLHGLLNSSAFSLQADVPQLDPAQQNRPRPEIPGYEILEELGRGGMGIVFKARQIGLNRTVALKMVLGGSFACAESQARFKSEAEAAANLDHPHIVPVYEVGEFQGQHYFSMKLVEAGSLLEHLDRFRHDQKAAAKLIAAVARAVHYAHQHGILHRDLKPSNILLDAQEQPYVTDFGLAKRFDIDSGLTASNAVVGTPGYLSPEQARGEKALSLAVDVWGLGAILYELLTGRAPYEAETPMKTVRLVLEIDPRRPRSLDTLINRDLETICVKCLQREPQHRYDSALAVAEDLEHWLGGEPIKARPVSWPERTWRWAKRRPAIAALSGLALLTALGGAAGITVAWLYALAGWNKAEVEGNRASREQVKSELRRDEAENHLYFSRIAQADLERRMNNPESARVLLDVCVPQAEQEIKDRRGWEWFYLKNVLNADLLHLASPHQEVVEDIAFGLDGQTLLTAGGTPFRPFPPDLIRVWDIWGTEAGKCRWKYPIPHAARQAVEQPDADRIVYVQMDGTIETIDRKANKTILSRRPTEGVPVLSPNGIRSAAYEGTTITVRNVMTGDKLQSFQTGPEWLINMAFSFDGRLLAANGKGSVRWWDVDTGQEVKSVPLGADSRRRPAFSRDGRLLALGLAGGQVRIWDVATGQIVQNLAGHAGDVISLAFSPNGQQVATAGADATVRLWSLKTGAETLLLRGHQGRVMCVAFHPSGKYLATGSGQPGHVKLWDLTRPQEYITISPPPKQPNIRIEGLGFSDNGQVLQIIRGSQMLQRCRADTGEDIDMTKMDFTTQWIAPGALVSFTSDGKTLALVTFADRRVVKIVDVATGKEKHQLHHKYEVVHIAFSKDDRRIATSTVNRLKDSKREIKAWDVQTAKQIMVREFEPTFPSLYLPGRAYGVIALSPDGTNLAYDEYSLRPDTSGKPELTFKMCILDLDKNQIQTTIDGFKAMAGKVVFSPDGRYLAISEQDHGVTIYDCQAKQRAHQQHLYGSEDETQFDLAFSPDNRRLAAASRVQVLLWDVITGQKVLALRGAPPRPGDNGFNPKIQWSPDGRLLAASHWNASVSIWDTSDRSSLEAKGRLHQAAEKRKVESGVQN
jgi:WD40 repeat protein